MSDPNRSPRTAFQPPPTLIPTPVGGVPNLVPGDSQGVDNDVTDHLKVQLLVRAYQVRPLTRRNDANDRSVDIIKPRSIPSELNQVPTLTIAPRTLQILSREPRLTAI